MKAPSSLPHAENAKTSEAQCSPQRMAGVRVMANYAFLRELINIDTDEHSMVFAIKTADDSKSLRRFGRGWKEVVVTRDKARNQRELEAEFARRGLIGFGIDPAWLEEVFASTDHPVEKITSKGGWRGDVLVTRHGSFVPAPSSSQCHFDERNLNFRQGVRKGTSLEFVQGIRPFLRASPELTFAYALGLVPPLAARIGRKGGIVVCFSAESSTGKTTSIRLAQSLSTAATFDTDLVDFSSTPNFLIDSAPAFGGQVTGFNDIKAGTEKAPALADKLQTVAFSALNGRVKGRKGEERSPDAEFNVYFLSAETSVHTLFEKAGRSLQDGDRARLLDIPIPSRDEGGIFASVPFDERDRKINDLDDFLKNWHGRVMNRWVRRIVAHEVGELCLLVKKHEDAFMIELGPLSSLENRIGKQFALIYATAAVAIEDRVLRVSQQYLLKTVQALFARSRSALSAGRQPFNTPNVGNLIGEVLTDANAFPTVTTGENLPEGVTRDSGFCRVDKTSASNEAKPMLFISKKGLAELVGLADPSDLDEPLKQLRGVGILKASEGELTTPVKQKGLAGRGRLLVFDLARFRSMRTN